MPVNLIYWSSKSANNIIFNIFLTTFFIETTDAPFKMGKQERKSHISNLMTEGGLVEEASSSQAELCARSTEILNLWPRRIMAEQKDTSSGVNTDYFQQGQLTQLAPMQHYENTRYQQAPPEVYHQAEGARQLTRMIYSAQLEEIIQDITYIQTLTNRLKNKIKNI